MRENNLDRDAISERFKISAQAAKIVRESELALISRFEQIDAAAETAQYRVLDAFRRHEVSSRHFNPSTGYGYGDEGRDKLAQVFADVFGAEDAIVSPMLMSGTHAISTALFGLAAPGTRILCVTGAPYDTMQKVIRGTSKSLEALGVSFDVLSLTSSGAIDIDAAAERIRAKGAPEIVYFQRSTGYDLRPAFTAEQLKDAMTVLRESCPEAVFFVDNCYGEFVNDTEPCVSGADVVAGSLIKNPGGGLAPTGGYIAGRSALIEQIAGTFSAPGVGREIGSYASGYQYFFQGLFMAPHTVAQALKGVVLAADVFDQLGYEVTPRADDVRGDITQVIILRDPELVKQFVRGIQRASAIDAHVVPYAWDMPGYEDQVIMAAGTFVQGASLELTADAPMRDPYAAYLQGGLTYAHAKLGVQCALSDVLRARQT